MLEESKTVPWKFFQIPRRLHNSINIDALSMPGKEANIQFELLPQNFTDHHFNCRNKILHPNIMAQLVSA